MGLWSSDNSRGWEAAGWGSNPRPAPCAEVVCVCGVRKPWYGVFRDYSAVSSVLSPVSMGVKKSCMTPQCSWVLLKKIYSTRHIESFDTCMKH